MKGIKLFETSLESANVIYSVFGSCSVFVVNNKGHLIPLYDFSGNGIRSTTNSLRKLLPGCFVGFWSSCTSDGCSSLPLPYRIKFDSCYVYF